MTKEEFFKLLDELKSRGATLCRISLHWSRCPETWRERENVVSLDVIENGKFNRIEICRFTRADLEHAEERVSVYLSWLKEWLHCPDSAKIEVTINES